MRETIVDNRPWGKFEQFAANEKCTVKLLHVDADKRLSYQYHGKRSEFWKVVRGKVNIVLDGKKKTLSEGDSIEIPIGAKHRIEGVENSVILEIAFGEFDENDIVRLEDDFNRK